MLTPRVWELVPSAPCWGSTTVSTGNMASWVNIDQPSNGYLTSHLCHDELSDHQLGSGAIWPKPCSKYSDPSRHPARTWEFFIGFWFVGDDESMRMQLPNSKSWISLVIGSWYISYPLISDYRWLSIGYWRSSYGFWGQVATGTIARRQAKLAFWTFITRY